MKRFGSLFILVILIFCFVSCNGEKTVSQSSTLSSSSAQKTSSIATVESDEPTVTSKGESSKPPISSPKPVTPKPTVTSSQPTYQSLKLRSGGAFKDVAFNFSLGKNTVEAKIFSDWTLKEYSSGYKILKGGKEIGYITSSHLANIGNMVAEGSGIYTTEFKSYYTIYKKANQHRVRFYYKCDTTQSQLYIDVIYTELSEALFDVLCSGVEYHKENVVNITPSENPPRILVLGNSYIATSEIGAFLQEMLITAGKNWEVEAVSIGGAHVSTYYNNPTYLGKMGSGNYTVVYQCGLYNDTYIDKVGELYNICKRSKTQFILFPAQNEQEHLVDSCVNLYQGLPVLNWQAELNELVDGGVDFFDLCYDDAFYHSKPVAGYVGAHMIYRSIFNELPPTINNGYMPEVNRILGDYVTTGKPLKTSTSPIFKLA